MADITITISCCEETGTLVAHWDDPQGRGGLTTQAERLSDLETSIRDAIEVHGTPPAASIRRNFAESPRDRQLFGESAHSRT